MVTRISDVSSVDLVHSPATADSLFESSGRVDGQWYTVDTAAARGGSVVSAPSEPSRLRGIHPKHPGIIEILSVFPLCPGVFRACARPPVFLPPQRTIQMVTMTRPQSAEAPAGPTPAAIQRYREAVFDAVDSGRDDIDPAILEDGWKLVARLPSRPERPTAIG